MPQWLHLEHVRNIHTFSDKHTNALNDPWALAPEVQSNNASKLFCHVFMAIAISPTSSFVCPSATIRTFPKFQVQGERCSQTAKLSLFLFPCNPGRIRELLREYDGAAELAQLLAIWGEPGMWSNNGYACGNVYSSRLHLGTSTCSSLVGSNVPQARHMGRKESQCRQGDAGSIAAPQAAFAYVRALNKVDGEFARAKHAIVWRFISESLFELNKKQLWFPFSLEAPCP